MRKTAAFSTKSAVQNIFFAFCLVVWRKLLTFASLLKNKSIGALSSAGLEHLPYKQRVGGSNPSAPTQKRNLVSNFGKEVFCVKRGGESGIITKKLPSCLRNCSLFLIFA